MMKNNMLKTILTFVIAFSLVFGFSACTNADNSELTDKITKLETSFATLQAKITALESANAAYKTQIDALKTAHATDTETLTAKIQALETANANYKTQITALTATDTELEKSISDLKADLDTLTASVVNATKIERVVIKPEDVGLDKPIAKYVGVEANTPVLSENPFNVKIVCSLAHRDYSFNYQLITFKTTLYVNNEFTRSFDVSITQAKSGESAISQTFNTNIPYDSSSTDIYTATWSEIVLYRFI